MRYLVRSNINIQHHRRQKIDTRILSRTNKNNGHWFYWSWSWKRKTNDNCPLGLYSTLTVVCTFFIFRFSMSSALFMDKSNVRRTPSKSWVVNCRRKYGEFHWNMGSLHWSLGLTSALGPPKVISNRMLTNKHRTPSNYWYLLFTSVEQQDRKLQKRLHDAKRIQPGQRLNGRRCN